MREEIAKRGREQKLLTSPGGPSPGEVSRPTEPVWTFRVKATVWETVNKSRQMQLASEAELSGREAPAAPPATGESAKVKTASESDEDE